MSSYVIGLGMGLGLAILLTSAIGLAQDRPAAQPAVQGHVDVFNSIQGRMVVMSSRSDGAPVEKGDIVCELDPRELKDRLATQDIVVRAAEFDLESATMAREATGMRSSNTSKDSSRMCWQRLRARSRSPRPIYRLRRISSTGGPNVRQGLRFHGRKGDKRAAAQRGALRARGDPIQEKGIAGLHEGTNAQAAQE